MLQAFVSGFECGREARDFTPHGVKELVIGLVALRELMLVPRGPMIARFGIRDKTVVIPLPGASVPLTEERLFCFVHARTGASLHRRRISALNCQSTSRLSPAVHSTTTGARCNTQRKLI